MPTLPRRWLLTLERLPVPIYLSDVGGDVGGQFYEPGIVSVGLPAAAIDFGESDQSRIGLSAPTATIVLDPAIARLFDPDIHLSRAEATLSFWNGTTAIPRVKAKVRNVRIGRTGEPHSFQLEETWAKNPDFPAAVADKTRFGKKELVSDADGKVLPQAFGDAYCQPGFAVYAKPSQEQVRYLIAGHSVKSWPTSFPWPTYPSAQGKVRDSIVGLHYGQNPILRDGFDSTGLLRGWFIDQGSWTQTGGNLNTTTTTSRLIWGTAMNGRSAGTAWTYSRQFSVRFSVTPLDAIAGRRVDFFYNWESALNHIRVSVRLDTGAVVLDVLEGGASALNKAHENTATILSTNTVQIDVVRGSLKVIVNDQEFSFGRIAGGVGGEIGIGNFAGALRFTSLSMPSTERRGSTGTSPNASIARFRDKRGAMYVADRYRGQPGQAIYATFHEAQGVRSAGDLVDRLIRRHSGYREQDLDELSLERMAESLSRFRVGSYFIQQAPIFDVIEQRLQRQFFFCVRPEGGLLRGFALNPTQGIERELRLGVELLEQHSEAVELDKFTRFRARFKYFAPLRKWEGKAKLDPSNNARLAFLETHGGGRRDFKEIELPDVVGQLAADQHLTYAAAIYSNPILIPYVMEASDWADIRWGTLVGLTDAKRRFEARPAFFVGRAHLTRDLVVNTFRTIDTEILHG